MEKVKNTKDKENIFVKGSFKDGSFRFVLNDKAINIIGENIPCEILVVDVLNEQRTTSQQFTISIEPSLTGNLYKDNKLDVETELCKKGLTYESNESLEEFFVKMYGFQVYFIAQMDIALVTK